MFVKKGMNSLWNYLFYAVFNTNQSCHSLFLNKYRLKFDQIALYFWRLYLSDVKYTMQEDVLNLRKLLTE